MEERRKMEKKKVMEKKGRDEDTACLQVWNNSQ